MHWREILRVAFHILCTSMRKSCLVASLPGGICRRIQNVVEIICLYLSFVSSSPSARTHAQCSLRPNATCLHCTFKCGHRCEIESCVPDKQRQHTARPLVWNQLFECFRRGHTMPSCTHIATQIADQIVSELPNTLSQIDWIDVKLFYCDRVCVMCCLFLVSNMHWHTRSVLSVESK